MHIKRGIPFRYSLCLNYIKHLTIFVYLFELETFKFY